MRSQSVTDAKIFSLFCDNCMFIGTHAAMVGGLWTIMNQRNEPRIYNSISSNNYIRSNTQRCGGLASFVVNGRIYHSISINNILISTSIYAGGITGYIATNTGYPVSIIHNCATVNDSITVLTSVGEVGCAVGHSGSASGTLVHIIERCYSSSSIRNISGNSYGSSLGFIGNLHSSIGTTVRRVDNYWDSQQSIQTSGTGATARTTSQMMNQVFANWDWNTMWTRFPDLTYPYFQHQPEWRHPIQNLNYINLDSSIKLTWDKPILNGVGFNHI